MAKLLGIDVGTSGCKVLLINESGKILKTASAEYPISVPKHLWSEQNPEDWWHGVLKCLHEIGETAPDAIGVAGQMHGAVFLDKDGEVIRPAILWNDQRTVEEVAEIDHLVGKDRVRAITCNPPMTGFQLPKILWLKRHEPQSYARLNRLLLPKDYIRYRLSGVMATEVSDASGTGILDVPGRKWSQEIFEKLGISADWLPDCFESSHISAHTRLMAELKSGIPIAGGGGDQAAAAVGTGAVVPGVISVSLGTSGVVFTAIPRPEFDPSGAAHTFCHANGEWHAMGVMLACGGALRWYRDTLAPGATYDELAEEASRCPVGANGLTFLPYLTGERCPHNDPMARASFSGLTLAHDRAHISRAVFEAISFGLRECFDLLKSVGASAKEVRINGGGAKSEFWVGLLADIFAVDCVTLEVDEGPAFGAAILAGCGIGIWPNVAEACAKVVKFRDLVKPSGANYGPAFTRYRNLYKSLEAWNHEEGS